MSWPQQLLCQPGNWQEALLSPLEGCWLLCRSHGTASPQLPPYSTPGLHFPAGRFGDLNQLPFQQQIKFFKEFSSISQLNIFKSLSSPTFPEQFACLHGFTGWKLISPSQDLSILWSHRSSSPRQSQQVWNPLQTSECCILWPRSWEQTLACLEKANSTFIPLLSRGPRSRNHWPMGS